MRGARLSTYDIMFQARSNILLTARALARASRGDWSVESFPCGAVHRHTTRRGLDNILLALSNGFLIQLGIVSFSSGAAGEESSLWFCQSQLALLMDGQGEESDLRGQSW